VFRLGSLTSLPASQRPDLVGTPTLAHLRRLGWLETVGVVEIDPAASDTAKSQEKYGLPASTLANCVVVGGRREGEERLAACVVLFTTRADVNGVVRRRLDVRKASFLPMDRAVEMSGMEYGGINPIGLPEGWAVLVDRRVVDTDVVLIGSGVRRSKILLPGQKLAELPGAEVVEGLANSHKGYELFANVIIPARWRGARARSERNHWPRCQFRLGRSDCGDLMARLPEKRGGPSPGTPNEDEDLHDSPYLIQGRQSSGCCAYNPYRGLEERSVICGAGQACCHAYALPPSRPQGPNGPPRDCRWAPTPAGSESVDGEPFR
jgi:prolyl-tRNA editing enzyme YbaK/EbsC (Cys-tRNA(Pro) deacylase)